MQTLVYFLLISLSFTSISFFKIGMAEFTLFHALVGIVMFFKVLIALKTNRYNIKAPRYLFMAALFLIIVNTCYYSHIKVSSFIFSLIIFFEILLLYNCLKHIDTKQIVRIMKTIIVLYFINIVISTIFIILNYKPPGLLGEIFQIYDFDHRIRPYGFADEPSYAAIVLIFALFVLFKSQNFVYDKKEFKWYAITTTTIMLTGSSYGYLFLGILLGVFLLKSNLIFSKTASIIRSQIFTKRQLVIGSLAGIGLFTLSINFLSLNANKSIQRLTVLVTSIASSNKNVVGAIKDIVYVDGSAGMRLVPTILLIDDFENSDWKYVLFGRGAGQSIEFFSAHYEGNTTVLGFIPAFIYNYGIFGGFIFFYFFIALFPKKKLLLFVLFFLFVLNADFNTQIFVYVLFTIMAAKKIEVENEKKLKMLSDAKD